MKLPRWTYEVAIALALVALFYGLCFWMQASRRAGAQYYFIEQHSRIPAIKDSI